MKKYLKYIFLFVINLLYTSDKLYLYLENINSNDKNKYYEYLNKLNFYSTFSETGLLFLNNLAILDENQKKEIFDNFNCMTYIETILALYISKNNNYSFEEFTNTLKKIIFRNSDILYINRYHYFSDWIMYNSKNNYIFDITNFFSSSILLKKEVNYITKNQNLYPKFNFEQNKQNLYFIQNIENNISNFLFYIPKNNVENILKQYIDLLNNLIVVFTSSIENLDCCHMGIVIKINNELHLLHSSSKNQKVMITEETLNEYILSRDHISGIILLKAR